MNSKQHNKMEIPQESDFHVLENVTSYYFMYVYSA